MAVAIKSQSAAHARTEMEKDLFILQQLVTKDFKIRYRRSVLGVAWSVLNPLLMMIVMAIVFSTIFAQGRNGSITPEDVPALPYRGQHHLYAYVGVYKLGPDLDDRRFVAP